MRLLPLTLLAALGCGAPGAPTPPPPAYVPGPAALAPVEAPVHAPVEAAADALPPREPRAEPEPEPEPRPDAPGHVVGRVAGRDVLASEILEEWNDISSRELWLVVERLVATRLALAEAQRLGIRLDPAVVEQRVDAEERELAAEVVRRGLDVTPEEFVRRELRMEPERYRDRLRRATIHQLLAERAVRAASLAAENLRVRVIVVPSAETMDEVTTALAAGADFAELARRHSVDDSAARGGLVPFVAWQEHAPLARLAFRTEVGEVGGPLETGDHRFLVRVEERRSAREGPWSAVGEAVEASLEEFPVTDGEFLAWKLAIEERYPVDLEPLVELLGTAR